MTTASISDFRELLALMSDETLETWRRHAEFRAFEEKAIAAIRAIPWGGSIYTETRDKGLQVWFLKVVDDYIFNGGGGYEDYYWSEDYRILHHGFPKRI